MKFKKMQLVLQWIVLGMLAVGGAARAGTPGGPDPHHQTLVLEVSIEGREMTVINPSLAQATVLGVPIWGAQPETCLTIDFDGVREVHLQVPGPVLYDAQGNVVWNQEQLAAIVSVSEDVSDEQLSGVFELQAGVESMESMDEGGGQQRMTRQGAVSFADGPTPFLQAMAGGEVTPKCGECLTGYNCFVYPHKSTCCSGGSGCMKCKTCIKVTPTDGVGGDIPMP